MDGSFRKNVELYPVLHKIKVPNQVDFLKAEVPSALGPKREGLYASPRWRKTQADFKETVDLSPFIISAL